MTTQFRVIKKEWVEKLKSSDFTTKDDSIFYNYLISPLCNVILNFIPESVAYFLIF